MLVIIFLTLCVVLMLTSVLGFSARTQKKVKSWLVISRCFYLLLLVTAATRFFYLIPITPIGATLKLVLAILWVILIELGFTKKQEQHVTIPLGSGLALLFIANLIFNYYF